jgi:DNA invertase Pin-like site-specific DNA recombinase
MGTRTATTDTPVSPVAYSYIRFSTPEQARGDSLRRQVEAAKEWCDKNGARLDTSMTLRDLGKSAYLGEHRKNPDRYALAGFLKLVEGGKIPRGSFLVIESLDRLTREHVRAGLMLCLGLIEAGVRIVQLSPTELVYDEKSDEMALMLMVVELSRGHRESKRKSDMIGGAWKTKRKAARAGEKQPPRRKNGKVTESLTDRLPSWIEEHEGKLRLIPAKVIAVNRAFQLAAAGYGLTLTLKQLKAEEVPAIGDSGKWVRSYLAMLLSDGRVRGHFQPRRRDGTPDGDVIENYYPRAVEEPLWQAARAGARERQDRAGRPGRHVNVFANLLHDARGSGTYLVTTRANTTRTGRRGAKHRTLITSASVEGDCPCWSFPFETFEAAVLSLLREVDPCEVLEPDAGTGDLAALAEELAGVEKELTKAAAFMDANGFSPTIGRRVAKLEARQRELAAALVEARQRSASPLSETWVECHSLIDALASAPDPEAARLRLRSMIRRVVTGAWLLVVPRKRDRLCAVQLRFADSDRVRDYLIFHRPSRANTVMRTEPEWRAKSLADVVDPGDLDLRRKEDAAALEKVLLAEDLGRLQRRLAGQEPTSTAERERG